MAALVREIERRCGERDLAPPDYKEIAARLRVRDQREVLRMRMGAAHPRSKLGRIVGRGATGPNVAERGDDPEATAMMTTDELETWLVHQIAGVYHHTVHRCLGKAPITAWREGVASLAAPRRHPSDDDRLYMDFLPLTLRTVQRGGLSLFNITYSDGGDFDVSCETPRQVRRPLRSS